MKIVCRKSGMLEDWFVIEKDVEPVFGMRQVSANGFALTSTARLSNADIEGYGAEMRALADAIEARATYSAKRCAVAFKNGHVELWSPRNSTHHGVISLEQADELVKSIREVCRE